MAEYERINRDLAPDPSFFKGDNRPVERVSWDDAQEFCQRLSAKTGNTYRLPSEAQWEYACRAGTETLFHFGEKLVPELANYYTEASYNDSPTAKSRRETTEVGSFPANEWGLHDMHGNVWEWCEDDWHNNYEGAPNDGSAWVESYYVETIQAGISGAPVFNDRKDVIGIVTTKEEPVLRGGSWHGLPQTCRSATRNNNSRDNRNNNIGFRVCCELPVGLSVAPASTLHC